jgi:hypothetical protein
MVSYGVQLTHEKGGKIKESCQNVLKKSILSIREFSELIGENGSSLGVPYAKLFHKRLHIAKNEQLRKHRGDYHATCGVIFINSAPTCHRCI